MSDVMPTNSGVITSFSGLFILPGAPVTRIEIPQIQRDYAQGRPGTVVQRIRDEFLNVLHNAVTTGNPVGLDFVYGDVKNGVLQPLDGQQRLTTLFLLHWYLACRVGLLKQEWHWKFSYATRASARLFCERLVQNQPPTDLPLQRLALSAWIIDQTWYLYPWRHDPTIQSMLVMLDCIHSRFVNEDCLAAWNRLIDNSNPAITFHLLPVMNMGLSEELYIKMNSRGKPLTEFENFKACFEQLLATSCPEKVDEFSRKIDGVWSDLLWRHKASASLDESFLRYFRFITEVSKWPDNDHQGHDALAEGVYASGSAEAINHIEWLFHAFDTWLNVEDIQSYFSTVFTTTADTADVDGGGRVALFGRDGRPVEVNLFLECCRYYGNRRTFSLGDALFLYAVILHRQHNTAYFTRRLRVLRNMIEASVNEVRMESMPDLIANVRQLIVEGTYTDKFAFNKAQISDERRKQEFLAEHPSLARALFRLEDHPLLRGCLTGFELEDKTFLRRAGAFHELFTQENYLALTGALLTCGNYESDKRRSRYQYGSPVESSRWRDLLTTPTDTISLRHTLGNLLDQVTCMTGPLPERLQQLQLQWLDAHEADPRFGWRYYFVKYPIMRHGKSGLYVGWTETQYQICMLDKDRLSSYYRDPYLSAIRDEATVSGEIIKDWFTGYENEERWLKTKCGIGLRSVADGIALKCPPEHAELFKQVCEEKNHPVRDDDGDQYLLQVLQADYDGEATDIQDRVKIGAELLRDLMRAGL